MRKGSRLRSVVAGLAALAGGSCGAPMTSPDASCVMGTEPAAFVASRQDFEDFRSWMQTSLGDSTLPGHPPGPRFVYMKERRTVVGCDGETRYANGTIIVKTVQANGLAQYWDLFAMVRRGGDFNAGGATGWEFFKLHVDAQNHVQVDNRGTDASLSSDTYPGASLPGGCNACHGTADARMTDGVLAGQLVP